MLQRSVHEWSTGRPLWQRDLLRRLAAGALDGGQRPEVRALVLDEPGAPAPVPVELEDLPADTGDHGAVELVSLGDLRNINCLAKGQTLRFAPGLNVVFGNNGAGKSGYGRLLRRVCRAAAPGEVLRDVFDPGASEAPQTATVEVRGRDGEEALAVDLALPPPRVLSAVGVFDARCADMYLSRPSVIDWSPSSLRLVRSLAAEQDALAAGLRDETVHRRERAPQVTVMPLGTPAAAAAAALDADTDLDRIEQLAALSDEERDELVRLEAAEVSGDAGRAALRAAAANRARAARAAAELLNAAANAVSDARLAELGDARAELEAAEQAEQALAQGAFAGLPVTGTGERAWRALWEAARTFVLEGTQHYPPHASEACPLCQQPLDDEAAERLARFEGFVRGEQRSHARSARERLDGAVAALPQEERLREDVDSLLEQLPAGEGVTAAREVLATIADRAARARALAVGEQVPGGAPRGSLDPLMALARADEEEVTRLAALDDAQERERLTAHLAALQARRSLGQALPVCRQRVAELRKASALEDAAKRLATTAVTRLVSQLAEEAITDRLRDQVAQELEGLNPVAGRVSVQPKASKGQPAVQLRFQESSRAAVGDVLSEGEQRALALAFFLAEAALREDASAIVLDDPVSSLDHDRRRWVAKRLVQEAQRRQVIVFTHDLAFLHFLAEASERAGIELHGQRVQRYQGRVGIVSDDLPRDAAAPGKRRKDLRHRLRTQLEPMHRDDHPNYAREVERWLLDLRRGYEYVVEEYLLQGVVRRFSAHVRMRQLAKVKPDPALVARIVAGIKDGSEDAHHEPPELQAPPQTPRELAALLDEFSQVCDVANPQATQRQLHLVEDQAGAA